MIHEVKIPTFQFKHCTIIRVWSDGGCRCNLEISIQALYDYKLFNGGESDFSYEISIQALYDYKETEFTCKCGHTFIFQFKHCTIIRCDYYKSKYE